MSPQYWKLMHVKPPILSCLVKVNGPGKVDCPICETCKTGVFIKTECIKPHLFCKGCFEDYYKAFEKSQPIDGGRRQDWRNVPCPTCGKDLCRFTLRAFMNKETLDMNQLTEHVPSGENQFPLDVEFEAAKRRSTRIKRAYQALGSRNEDKKNDAARFNGTPENTVFTRGAHKLFSDDYDLRYLRLSYKPRRDQDRTFEYVVVATKSDTISDIAKVCLAPFRQGEGIVPQDRDGFRQGSRQLDWDDSIEKLGLFDGNRIEFHV